MDLTRKRKGQRYSGESWLGVRKKECDRRDVKSKKIWEKHIEEKSS